MNPSERRQSCRVAANQICSIIFENGEEEKCMITNISVGGAEIIRYFIDELPKDFMVQIENNLMLPAHSVWNRGNTYGLRFKI